MLESEYFLSQFQKMLCANVQCYHVIMHMFILGIHVMHMYMNVKQTAMFKGYINRTLQNWNWIEFIPTDNW